jgi:hypothetical protein
MGEGKMPERGVELDERVGRIEYRDRGKERRVSGFIGAVRLTRSSLFGNLFRSLGA